MSVSQEEINRLREAFLQELNGKGENAVHPKDLQRVKEDDSWLRRFLLHHDQKIPEALQMMWGALTWRKELNVNDITESSVKMEILAGGGFFPRGRDKDGKQLFIFKCKKYVKGAQDPDELRKCVIYWFERLEREGKGDAITLFFDMDGCGLANMDLEFTKYLIGLFKDYYPFFLNYILIFEMPWVLSAAFKIIKSWLPEKAVQKIKFVSKKDIKEYVPLDQALKCWGGEDDYTYTFLPETSQEAEDSMGSTNNRKVHFADGSPMSEIASTTSDKEDGGLLSVQPTSVITFVKEGNEMVSELILQNTDKTTNISYKLKTTCPEKFRVRPSAGCLTPGAKAVVHLNLLQGFQIGGLSKDKFLVMSIPVDSADLSTQELTELWKNTAGKKVHQHRLRCAQTEDVSKNGAAIPVGASSESNQNTVNKLSASIADLNKCQLQLNKTIKHMQYLQIITLVLVLVIGVLVSVVLKKGISAHENMYCQNANTP